MFGLKIGEMEFSIAWRLRRLRPNNKFLSRRSTFKSTQTSRFGTETWIEIDLNLFLSMALLYRRAAFTIVPWSMASMATHVERRLRYMVLCGKRQHSDSRSSVSVYIPPTSPILHLFLCSLPRAARVVLKGIHFDVQFSSLSSAR